MNSKLFVRNLDYDTTEEDVKTFLSSAGDVKEVKLIKDKYTDKIKGFGFITMGNGEEAAKAIAELDGQSLNGRDVRIDEYKEMDRSSKRSYPPRGERTGNSRDERFNRSW